MRIPLLTSVLLMSVLCLGQFTKNYAPLKVYDPTPELVNYFKTQLKNEFKDTHESPEIQELNAERLDNLMKAVNGGLFIQNDSIETYLNKVVRTIVSNNSVRDYGRRVFLIRSPYCNAFCYGQGIYFVTTALLARLSSEDEMAFILGHEMAHDELDHVRKKVITESLINLKKKSKDQFKKLLSGKLTPEEREEYRKIIYGVRRHDRQGEIQADTIALVMITNAGYSQEKALTALEDLEYSMDLKYDIAAELFLPFDTEEYPFQIDWLHARLSVYQNESALDNPLVDMDSVMGHPDFSLRQEAVKKIVTNTKTNIPHQSAEFVNAVTALGEFETVETCYRVLKYDLCLYNALQLLNRYPSNVYLTSRIGKVLLDLCNARDDLNFEILVSRYTLQYSEEARLVNNLLHNLSTKELKELTYHFLNNKKYFNTNEKSHYFLLWKICEITYRNDQADQVKKDYKEKFGKSLGGYKYK